MNINALIVVRLSSTRLPRKAVLKISGKPMIELMVERVKAAELINKIILTTSIESSDDYIEEIAKKIDVNYFRGSLNNVMERICQASKQFNTDIIIELLGDNPLVDPKLIDDVIKFYLNGNYDYVSMATNDYSYLTYSSKIKKLFPLGIRVQVYSRMIAEQYIKFQSNPEELYNKHPCSYIYENPDIFRLGFFEAIGKWSFLNLPEKNFAVNNQNDFLKISRIFENNYSKKDIFSIKNVIENDMLS